MSDLVRNPEDRFSQNEAHIIRLSVKSCDFVFQCVRQYLSVMISEGNVLSITCPDAQCKKQGKLESSEVSYVTHLLMGLVTRKHVFGVSQQVRHKPGCTATEHGQRLEIFYLGVRGNVLCSFCVVKTQAIT